MREKREHQPHTHQETPPDVTPFALLDDDPRLDVFEAIDNLENIEQTMTRAKNFKTKHSEAVARLEEARERAKKYLEQEKRSPRATQRQRESAENPDEEPTDRHQQPAFSPQTPEIVRRTTWPLVQKTKTAPSKLRRNILAGVTALAGLFGVKITFDSLTETAERAAEQAAHAVDTHVQAKMSGFPPARYEQTHASPPETAQEPKEPTQRIYTLQPGDNLWNIAEDILETQGIEDPTGNLTRQAVQDLLSVNHITGDPATSRNMWAGATLDVSPVYDLVVTQQKTPSPQEHATTYPEPSQNAAPEEIFSTTLNYRGETIWSRTLDMLHYSDIKPTGAKRAVLGAIILVDSQKSETDAMRLKYKSQKTFDAQRDTLNMERVQSALADLQSGMSPAEVAKKYNVQTMYKKLRTRK